MNDKTVQETVSLAVGRAYEQWAAEHPSLAAVIDRIAVSDRIATSLRDSEEFRSAIAAYRRGQGEIELLDALTDLARPFVTAILGG